MAEFRTVGIVLKRQNYGEADRICRIFTREFGLVAALAKGVKKVKSRRAGAFEFLSESELRLYRRTGELFLVTEAVSRRPFPTDDLLTLKVAYCAAEWLLALLPLEKPSPQVYALTRDFLAALRVGSEQRICQLAFQTKLLRTLGFLPSGEKFPIELRQFLRFLLTRDFTEIAKLKQNDALLVDAEKITADIFFAETDKTSRVLAATADWR